LTQLLGEVGKDRAAITGLIADVGPGSFIGVRVATTLAKSMAFALEVPVYAVSSFDWIAHDQTVVFPSKRGEWFVRRVGEAPFRTEVLPTEPLTGFGPGIEPEQFPSASRLSKIELTASDPFSLVPSYFIEPSISTPKKKMGGLA
jgi:tRNA threonylcarbamoyladenosine biosynthesis protein TsaB